VSPVFVPHADSEAFCSGKLVQALAACGSDVTVVRCPDYWRDVDESSVWRHMDVQVEDVPCVLPRHRVDSLRHALRFQTASYARWVGAVVRRALRLHAVKPFDVVYSRSLPMFAHVGGYWCSRRLGVPWIANINDPWDYHLFPGQTCIRPSLAYRFLSKLWLQRTLRAADLVTGPSARLHALNAAIAGTRGAFQMIPHIGCTGAEPAEDRGLFKLVHAGKLGSSEITGRSSQTLLAGLKAFLDGHPQAQTATRLVLVGPRDDATRSHIERFGLSSFVKEIGKVSYEESLRHIGSASACVLVEADCAEGIYFPSKVVDYVAAGKPILALSPRTGEIADLGLSAGVLRVDPTDALAVRHAIAGLYSDWKAGRIAWRAPSPEVISRYQAANVARQFLTAAAPLLVGSPLASAQASANAANVPVVGPAALPFR